MRLKHIIASLTILILGLPMDGAEYKREITVAPDGSGDYTTLTDALEGIRAYMDYRVTVNLRPGVYREKVVIPSWIENVEFVGAGADSTVISWGDYASLDNMGTFRTYTVKVEGCDITFRNLTIENSAGEVGQAVALHTEGDRLKFDNCSFRGNQDTVFTGGRGSRLLFDNCYIEGTTDYIFGPSTALFRDCTLHSKRNSYITAASTPDTVMTGYVMYRCRLTAAEGVDKVYLGRPWRPYASTYFIDCEMGGHIVAAGWHNWRNPDNEKTARYGEYGSHGAGAEKADRVGWATALSPSEAARLSDPAVIFTSAPGCMHWVP